MTDTQMLIILTVLAGITFLGVLYLIYLQVNTPSLNNKKRKEKKESLPIGVVGNVQIVKPGMSKPGFAPIQFLKYGDKVIQRKKRGDEPVEVKSIESTSMMGCIKIGIEGETSFITSPSTYFLVYEGREESQKPASEIQPGMMIGGKRVGTVEVLEKEVTVYCPLIEGKGGVKNVVLEVGKALVVCYAKSYNEDESALAPAEAKKNGNGKNGGVKSQPSKRPTDRRHGRR